MPACLDQTVARVYGGIHFRFDQDACADLGRDVATCGLEHNLRRVKHSHHDDDDCDQDDEHDSRHRD